MMSQAGNLVNPKLNSVESSYFDVLIPACSSAVDDSVVFEYRKALLFLRFAALKVVCFSGASLCIADYTPIKIVIVL